MPDDYLQSFLPLLLLLKRDFEIQTNSAQEMRGVTVMIMMLNKWWAEDVRTTCNTDPMKSSESSNKAFPGFTFQYSHQSSLSRQLAYIVVHSTRVCLPNKTIPK